MGKRLKCATNSMRGLDDSESSNFKPRPQQGPPDLAGQATSPAVILKLWLVKHDAVNLNLQIFAVRLIELRGLCQAHILELILRIVRKSTLRVTQRSKLQNIQPAPRRTQLPSRHLDRPFEF